MIREYLPYLIFGIGMFIAGIIAGRARRQTHDNLDQYRQRPGEVYDLHKKPPRTLR